MRRLSTEVSLRVSGQDNLRRAAQNPVWRTELVMLPRGARSAHAGLSPIGASWCRGEENLPCWCSPDSFCLRCAWVGSSPGSRAGKWNFRSTGWCWVYRQVSQDTRTSRRLPVNSSSRGRQGELASRFAPYLPDEKWRPGARVRSAQRTMACEHRGRGNQRRIHLRFQFAFSRRRRAATNSSTKAA